ncbi:MAG: BrnT family toxin [Desulfovibrio fairfieldensis]|uniref:BrnT family toxin n=1 Tax=unclassified Desulfovibrio TaxID=2593640 RepID=UPI001E4AAC3A|nr:MULTISPECIES: BrnT family toxin [unclassified Desulfovibrio]MEE0816310.1 BrnT family toxin [Desulfovibrio fairfieldensis]
MTKDIFFILFYMKFEYDPAKSSSNKVKHGLDFEEAKGLWSDEDLLVMPLNFEDEPRKACVGVLGGKCWTAIITCRHTSVRLISVRRARKDEVAAYESE